MVSDPEPCDRVAAQNTQRTVGDTNSHGVDRSPRPNLLEVEPSMARILLKLRVGFFS